MFQLCLMSREIIMMSSKQNMSVYVSAVLDEWGDYNDE